MKLLPVGISNRLFYYMSAGENAAFDICFRFDLKERLDRKALSVAAEKAIQSFPEFAIRPVVHENGIWAVPNQARIPLLEDEEQGSNLCYGTEDTGGYLFAFRCREDGFSFSYFHGMTDFYGIWHFFRTLFYYYALEKGLPVQPDEFVRTDAEMGVAEDEKERLDPYVKFAPSGKGTADEKQEAIDAFGIPETYYDWASPYNFGYEIRCPLKDFLQTVKRYRTSVVPFLSLLAAQSIADSYEWDGKSIRIMASANMRKYYQARTMVNFSDATFLSYDKELAALPMEEQAMRLRETLKGQMTKEHFDPLVAQKVQMVRGFSDAGIPIVEWNRRFSQPPKEGDRTFMTVALTYPGSIDLPEEYQPLIREITRVVGTRGANVFGINATTYGDTMYLRSCQRFDSDAIMQGIERGLIRAGLSTQMAVLERYRGNQVLVDRLQQI
ncbi:MAG: hypothetical protein IIZ54_05485 [Selenomonadaceae bacterium]|nr:hypothetical protein [Selenomonadaceae bacterium]